MSHSKAKSRCVPYSKDSLPPGQRAGGLQPIEKDSGFMLGFLSCSAVPHVCRRHHLALCRASCGNQAQGTSQENDNSLDTSGTMRGKFFIELRGLLS